MSAEALQRTAERLFNLCCSLPCVETQHLALIVARIWVMSADSHTTKIRVGTEASQRLIAASAAIARWPETSPQPDRDCGVVVDTTSIRRFFGFPSDLLKIRLQSLLTELPPQP